MVNQILSVLHAQGHGAQPLTPRQVLAGWSGGTLDPIAHVLEPASICSLGHTSATPSAQSEQGTTPAPRGRPATPAADMAKQTEASVTGALVAGQQSESARQQVVLCGSAGGMRAPHGCYAGVGNGWVTAVPLNNLCQEQRCV